MNKKVGAAVLCLAMILSSCAKPKPNVDGVDPAAFVEGVNTFNWNLFGKLDGTSNQFYSAYGISEALALAANGANGDTYDELLGLYGFSDLNQFNEEALALSNKIVDDGFVNANSIWIDENLPKSDDFDTYEKTVSDYHDADVRAVDFAGNTDQVKKDITGWVKSQTKGFISDYQSTVTEDTSTDIINAVYFKEMWDIPFDINDTYEQKFYGYHQEDDVSMMHQYSMEVPYYETDSLKAITLDYEGSSKSASFITTKDENENIAIIWNSLSDDQKNEFLKNLDESYSTELGTIAIPNLEMDITMDGLKEALTELNVGTMFTSKADFSKIADGLFVSSIVHRAKVKMNEAGTEAAAVTEITFDTMMAQMEEEKPEFIADHPYLFIIRDTETGVILFTGLVQNIN